MTLLIFLAVLGVLVVAHEMGHFSVAKLARVKVLEFGVGYPPRVFSFTRGDTTYSLNALPLGGFVKLLGEEDPTDPQSFARRPPLTRLAVLAAGPVMNAVLPVVLLTAFFMVPRDVPVTDVVILEVVPGSPAAGAGVRPGDTVRKADGRTIDNSTDLITAVQRRLGADTTWVLERGGRTLQVRLEPRVAPPSGQGATGISLTDARVRVARVAPGSQAEQAGLRTGDLFLSAGPQRVLFADDAGTAVAAALLREPGAAVDVRVMRGQGVATLTVTPAIGGVAGYEATVRPPERRALAPWRAVPASVGFIWDVLVMTRNEIAKWIAGGGGVQVSGPIGIAQTTGEVARAGFSPLLTWMALLSINLAIFNILPFPALDGGRIAFVLLELARRGKRVSAAWERRVHFAGFALLMGLVLLVSIGDIRRWLS